MVGNPVEAEDVMQEAFLKAFTNPADSMRFEQTEPLYYLRYGKGIAHLAYSQKTLIKTLQPIQQNIVNYIKSNKINTKNEAKLIDLMNFIDNQPN